MLAQLQRAGRFHGPVNNRLRDLPAFLDAEQVVPGDTRVSFLVALGLLIVCLVNTVGLLLAKFLRRSSEIGVRRALGAPRIAIYGQFLTEAAVIGVAGGLLGLVLTGARRGRHRAGAAAAAGCTGAARRRGCCSPRWRWRCCAPCWPVCIPAFAPRGFSPPGS